MKSTAKPNQKAAVKKAGFKYTKPIVITAVVLAVVIAAAIVLPKIFNSASSTRITTYQVEEITYGNVSTTISGSGTLTLSLIHITMDAGRNRSAYLQNLSASVQNALPSEALAFLQAEMDYRQFALYPVSYTHLDVYKRQAPAQDHRLFRAYRSHEDHSSRFQNHQGAWDLRCV